MYKSKFKNKEKMSPNVTQKQHFLQNHNFKVKGVYDALWNKKPLFQTHFSMI